MKKQNRRIDRLGNAEAPQWLVAALRLAGEAVAFESQEFTSLGASDSFRLRCRQGARRALLVRKLRQERQRIGFLPVALVDYVQALARVAEVCLPDVLGPAGVEDVSPQEPEAISKLGHLMRQVGMSLRETLAHLRIGFAERQQSTPMALLVANRRARDPRRGQLDDCEAVLSQIEAQYDARRLRDLRVIEQAVRASYQEGEGEPI